MKKNFMYLMAAIMTCSLSIVFTACGSDDKIDTNQQTVNNDQPAEKTLFDNYDISKIQVVRSGEINVYEELQRGLQEAKAGNSDDDKMAQDFYTEAINNLENHAKELAAKDGSNSTWAFMNGWFLDYAVIDIPTHSADGKEIKMSTLIAWPKLFKEHRADHVILGCHATVTEDVATPSHFKTLDMKTDVGMICGKWASASIGGMECLVIMPDYEGYGTTKDRSHPYLNRETQAEQCVDALIQGIKYYNQQHKGLGKNYKIVSMGYSQGGAVAAAAYRYCLDHPEVRKALPTWEGAVCGDGPYDPYATILEYCEKDRLYLPCAPILMLKGLCDTDKEMVAAGLKPADFLSTWTMESGILERLAAKDQPSHLCDACINGYGHAHPNTFSIEKDNDLDCLYYRTSQVLNKDTYDFFKSKGQTLPADENMKKKLKLLEHCLKKNSIWYKDDNTVWMPPTGSRFTFFHSTKDEVVGYTNLQSLIDKWSISNSSCKFVDYTTKTFTHIGTGKAYYIKYADRYVEEILRGKWGSGNAPVNAPSDLY